MSAAADWVYAAPKRPKGYEDQCYYRAGLGHCVKVPGATADSAELKVFRFAGSTSTQLTFERGFARLSIELDLPALKALFNALGDALEDIAPVEAEHERIESFARIQDELRDCADPAGPGVCYAHPDVHYVPADQVMAKVDALEAAGAKRYIVLPEPAVPA